MLEDLVDASRGLGLVSYLSREAKAKRLSPEQFDAIVSVLATDFLQLFLPFTASNDRHVKLFVYKIACTNLTSPALPAESIALSIFGPPPTGRRQHWSTSDSDKLGRRKRIWSDSRRLRRHRDCPTTTGVSTSSEGCLARSRWHCGRRTRGCARFLCRGRDWRMRRKRWTLSGGLCRIHCPTTLLFT